MVQPKFPLKVFGDVPEACASATVLMHREGGSLPEAELRKAIDQIAAATS